MGVSGGVVDVGERLLRNRSFTLLWVGNVFSELGLAATSVAMPLLVLSLTHSPAKAGLVGFARAAAFPLSALPAGVLADRFDRRAVLIACGAARGVAIGSVVLVLALGHPPLAQLAVVAFAGAALETVSAVAERGLLTAVVPMAALPDAIAANEARTSVGAVGGPPIGGALFGLARGLPFLADAVSAVAAGVAALGVRTTAAQEQAPREPTPRAIRAGLRWLWQAPFLRDSSLLYGAANLTLAAVELLAVLIARHHGASSAAIGVGFAIIGLGGVAGAILAGPLRRRLPQRWAVIGEAWVSAICVPVLLVCHSPVLIGLVIAVMVLPMALSTSIVVSQRLTLTPDQLRGRVQAGASFIALSVAWIGPLATGLLFQGAGQTGAVLALTGWTLAVATAATFAKGLRHPPVASPSAAAATDTSNPHAEAPTRSSLAQDPR